MAELVSWMPIRLKPGVDVAEFERFVAEELPLAPFPPGMKGHILKGERGERVGGYVVMNVFDSVEARNRYFPSFESEVSEAFRGWMQANAALVQKMTSYVETEPYTDYLPIYSQRS